MPDGKKTILKSFVLGKGKGSHEVSTPVDGPKADSISPTGGPAAPGSASASCSGASAFGSDIDPSPTITPRPQPEHISMSLLVVGSIAFDTVQTPHGLVEDALGGSATYFSYAASYFTPVRLVGVVGEDFPDDRRRILEGRNVDTSGLIVEPGGKTFRWRGKYEGDMNNAETLEVHLNVLGTFNPDLPPAFVDTPVRLPGQRQPVDAAQGPPAVDRPQARRGRHDELLDRDPAR